MKVLVVDDEHPARERLKQIIGDTDGYEVVGEAGNGREAVQLASKLQPDIVLLDIRMPGMDGIEAANHLNQTEHPPAVVFTTAYDEYAIDAFAANAIGYVLKPIRRSRLEAALKQATRLASASLETISADSQLAAARSHVCARVHGDLKLIPIEDVACFHADQKYVSVAHDFGQDLIDDSLKSLEQEFESRFVRIHRSVLVAVNRIEQLEKVDDGGSRVVLREGSQVDDKQLIISRRHLAEVRRRLKGT